MHSHHQAGDLKRVSLHAFIREDVPRTLFPLNSPRIVIECGTTELSAFIEDEVFSGADVHPHFVQAPVAFALKGPMETRRVHLLDPVATLYLYNFVFSNAGCFKAPARAVAKRRYGYHLKNKMPISATEEHQRFRERIVDLKKKHRYVAKVDIANCFSGFYHHDIVSSLKGHVGEEASRRFGVFLREINGGRSVSCFPHGYFPTKAIGNLYLSFIEDNAGLRSPAVVRYLDDIYIFGEARRTIEADIYRLQVLLSAHNLYLNTAKTSLDLTKNSMRLPKTGAIRKSLLAKRAAAVEKAYDDAPEEVHLTDDEFEYLSSVISATDVAEEDVELALALITEDEAHAERLVELVFKRYPHLIKNLYTHLINSGAFEAPKLFELVEGVISSRTAHEFVLFWCARILLGFYKWDSKVAKSLLRLYDHANSTEAVKSAILECQHLSYGMADRKEAALKNAGANLIAIGAAVGLRELEHGKRNQLYKYAAASAPLMFQITRALQKYSTN